MLRAFRFFSAFPRPAAAVVLTLGEAPCSGEKIGMDYDELLVAGLTFLAGILPQSLSSWTCFGA